MPIDCNLHCKSEQDNITKILIQLNKIRDSKLKLYENNEEENELELKYTNAGTDLNSCLSGCNQRNSDGQRGQGGRNRKYIRKTKSRSSRTRRTNYRKKTTRRRRR